MTLQFQTDKPMLLLIEAKLQDMLIFSRTGNKLATIEINLLSNLISSYFIVLAVAAKKFTKNLKPEKEKKFSKGMLNATSDCL